MKIARFPGAYRALAALILLWLGVRTALTPEAVKNHRFPRFPIASARAGPGAAHAQYFTDSRPVDRRQVRPRPIPAISSRRRSPAGRHGAHPALPWPGTGVVPQDRAGGGTSSTAYSDAHKAPTGRRRSPFMFSGWIVLRQGGAGSGLAPSGQLGAGQAGLRLRAPLLPLPQGADAGVSLRVTSAIAAPRDEEAAIGLSFRIPGRVTTELLVERRQKLSGRKQGRFGALVAAGIDDVPLAGRVSASGYGQAGVAGLSRPQSFADGALRVEYRLTDRPGTELRLAAGAWGAAQDGLSRLDAGPGISARMPPLPARLSLEWRQRLAGNARPGSGLVLTLSGDF